MHGKSASQHPQPEAWLRDSINYDNLKDQFVGLRVMHKRFYQLSKVWSTDKMIMVELTNDATMQKMLKEDQCDARIIKL